LSTVQWLVLAGVSGLGPMTATRLIERFGSVEAVFGASDDELLAVPQSRLTADMVRQLRTASLEPLEAELTSLADEGLQVLTRDHPNYPANLSRLPNRPIVLFVRGDLRANDEEAVAIVGTREPSERGRRIAQHLAQELSKRGLTIVSGLALGIDTAAHRGALDAGGRTLAVLGLGLRQPVHPRQNADLAEEIAASRASGAVLSELMPNEPLRRSALMIRDRIVSGLSRAVIVVEAQEKSGSLDTAARALTQGRGVYAVPGSPGTQKLLAEGANLLDAAGLDLLIERVRGHEPQEPTDPQSDPDRGKAQLSFW
jgi:DNA processing protein